MTEEAQEFRSMVSDALINYQMPCTESAIRMICMIAAHESGAFLYVKQKGGIALSFFQIEPRTFADLQPYCMKNFPKLAEKMPCSQYKLVFDPSFAAAVSRAYLLRIKEPLPAKDDFEDMARYCKQYWNTYLGKATSGQYFKAYQKHFIE